MVWTRYIIAFILFSKVFEIDSCLSANNKRISTYLKNRSKLCNEITANEFCFNGGTCYVIQHKNKFDYHCNCPEHFSGERCSIDDRKIKVEDNEKDTVFLGLKEPCDEPYKTEFCFQNATCYTLNFNNSPDYHCECPDGFRGLRCEEKSPDGFYGNGLKKQ